MKINLVALSLSFVLCFQSLCYSQDLNIGTTQEFDTLNQTITGMLASQYVYYAVGRTLVIIDPDGKWVPQMAESIPSLKNGGASIITANGKKKIKAVWKIKEKASWSDGKPVTCADFKLSLDIANTPTVAMASKDDYALVESITWNKSTPKVCTFTYNEARWDYYQIGRFVALPDHIEREVYEKHKGEREGYDKNTLYTKDPTRSGLYNGPYQVAEFKPGSHVLLTPNPYFYGNAPYFKKVVIKVIPNTGTLEANLQTKSIDIINTIGYSLDQAIEFEKRMKTADPNIQVYYKPSMTYEHIDLDLTNPILKDLNVRQALLYALNREAMVKALYEGLQPAAFHGISTSDPWYTADPKKIRIYKYDKKKAAELLDKAGWKLKEDGARYKNGQKLSLRFLTTAGNKSRETVQIYLQNQWKEVGIETTIKNEPARVFFGETMKKGKHDGMAMYAWIVFPERSPRPFLHSESIPSEKNGWSGRNVMGWSNKKADQLIEKIEIEFDPHKRKLMAHDLLKQYTEDVPTLPLFYRTDVAVTRKKMLNFELPGHIYLETNNIENWKFAE